MLDLPCGTGQSFKALHEGIRPEGRYVGVDASRGMLSRAKLRGRGHETAHFLQADARTFSGTDLEAQGLPPQVDRLHVFLGLTTFADWEQAWGNLWSLLRPGGRFVVVDVFNDRPGLQGRMVEIMAQADLSRRAWSPIEAVAEGFDRQTLSNEAVFGGELWLACGRKPQG